MNYASFYKLSYVFDLVTDSKCSITNSDRPLPPPGAGEEEEDAVLHEYPWIDRPIRMDYGYNVKVGSNVYINSNCTFIDTCTISLGSRTLLGPNVSFFSGTHPVDPDLRNGTNGPEFGKPITVGNDCWIGGNATILAGVTIGEGCTVGAASVVTKVLSLPGYFQFMNNLLTIDRMSLLFTSWLETQLEFYERLRGNLKLEEVTKREQSNRSSPG